MPIRIAASALLLGLAAMVVWVLSSGSRDRGPVETGEVFGGAAQVGGTDAEREPGLGAPSARIETEREVPPTPEAPRDAEPQAGGAENAREDVTPRTAAEIEAFAQGCLAPHRNDAGSRTVRVYEEQLAKVRARVDGELGPEVENAVWLCALASTERAMATYDAILAGLKGEIALSSNTEARTLVSGTVTWIAPPMPGLWGGAGATIDFFYRFREGDYPPLDEAMKRVASRGRELYEMIKHRQRPVEAAK
ncbi:MAG: hypothetical protein IT457_11895 [Planctomycetes bacterium]|nr:hypothetical protein [Planctomycetota bacterium]